MLSGALDPTQDDDDALSELFGRKEEMQFLIAMLQDFKVRGGGNGAHVVKGGGGIGKHRLTHELMRIAELEFDLSVLHFICRPDPPGAFGVVATMVNMLLETLLPGVARV